MIISALQYIFQPLFGKFEREEFKKFLRMGLIFTCIIGAYWTLRTLKNSIFITLVGSDFLPYAKTVSLILLIPTVIIYTKILDKYTREKTFYLISLIYGFATLGFAVLLANGTVGLADGAEIASRTGAAWFGTQIVGYTWYTFVESFGSLFVALFWAIASDTTLPESAKKGFSLVVALGQVGGIVGPYGINSLPRMLGFQTSAFSVGICAFIIFSLIFLLQYFLTATPKHLLVSFVGKNETSAEKEQEPGLLEGLRLLLEHKYLLCLFGVSFFYEFIITIFDFHFQKLASLTYSGTELSEYMGLYGSSVNVVSLACLLLGVSNITRLLGVTTALCLMPIIIAGAIVGFISFESLNFLFALMVGSKAINYALNGPALKQLYIPTTHDVRFKAQAWIETFGSRSSKEGGSIFNMLYGPLKNRLGEVAGRAQHVMLGSYIGFGLVGIWFFIALYLGQTYQKAVDEKRVVC